MWLEAGETLQSWKSQLQELAEAWSWCGRARGGECKGHGWSKAGSGSTLVTVVFCGVLSLLGWRGTYNPEPRMPQLPSPSADPLLKTMG